MQEGSDYAATEDGVDRPRGVVVACVWDSRSMPLLQSFWDAALTLAAHAELVADLIVRGLEHHQA